jgi:hypothetical protein
MLFIKKKLRETTIIGVTSFVFLTVLNPISVKAFTVTGNFKDPLVPSLYPNSMLTGNFAFNSELINAQGFVSSIDINFRSLETSSNPDGFNGTGWTFYQNPFVFNAKANLFEGIYAIQRSCLDGEGCPPNTLGQSIENPNSVFWDVVPGQVVILNPVPEPHTILGSGIALGFALGFGRFFKRKNQKD